MFQNGHAKRDGLDPVGNQIYLVTLRPTQLTQASFLQKNQMLQNVFFDISNLWLAKKRVLSMKY